MNDVLKFENNVPVQVRLVYAAHVGPRQPFWSIRFRQLAEIEGEQRDGTFAVEKLPEPDPGDKLQEGLVASILVANAARRREENGRAAIVAPPPATADVAASAASSTAVNQQPVGANIAITTPKRTTGQKLSLIDEVNALVDDFAAVLDRALRKHEGRVKPDELRAIFLTAAIHSMKAGRNA
ncbi:MAG: hypothetical protein ABSF62_02460 [Bryobacteraceae bacterium]